MQVGRLCSGTVASASFWMAPHSASGRAAPVMPTSKSTARIDPARLRESLFSPQLALAGKLPPYQYAWGILAKIRDIHCVAVRRASQMDTSNRQRPRAESPYRCLRKAGSSARLSSGTCSYLRGEASP